MLPLWHIWYGMNGKDGREEMVKDRFNDLKERAQAYSASYDPAFVTEYMKTHCPGEADALLAQAGRLMEQTFVFEDKWDMEPCSTPYTLKEMTWDQSPNQDPEWIFMLNRHEYLPKLLLAYRLTGNRAYIEKLEWYMDHWIASNPILPEGTVTTRTIDTGIRCMSWQFLLVHLIGEGLMGRQKAEQILETMSRQFVNMKDRYIPKYTLSNWGLLQTASICLGYEWFEAYLPGGGLREWAWKELLAQLGLQVLPDGSHWEQSIMYHMEVLLSSMKLLALGRDGLAGDRPWLLEKVEEMSRYVMYAAGPDHCQIAQCDSDVTDVRDVLVKAGVFTGKGEFRYTGFASMDLDSAWLLGRRGIEKYESLVPVLPGHTALNAEDTGNIYVRSGWSRDSHFTYLQCGPLGSGHGHADLTHISLYYEGRPFLVDSGRYTYREDDPRRPGFKSAQAHNVCVLDGQSQGIPDGAWGYASYGEYMKNYYREQGLFRFCEMAYRGTLEGGGDYLVHRRVMMADEGLWLIVNDIKSRGNHVMREYYHMDPEVRARENGQEGWSLSSGESTLNLSGPGCFVKGACEISKTYNQLSPAVCLVRESGFSDRHVSWTCLAGKDMKVGSVPVYQDGNPEPVPETEVVSRSFTAPSGESWCFLIWNRETFKGGKMYRCQGIPLYAKAAVLHSRDGNTVLYRLKF